MDQTSFKELYKLKKYDEVIQHSDSIRESLSDENIIFLIKSLIHTVNEDDPRVKDLLFLFLFLQKKIAFQGSFTLSIDHRFTTLQEIDNFGNLSSGMIEILQSDTSIEHIRMQYQRLREGKKEGISNKEALLLFLFCCLELYDLEHDEYPLLKWLLNHFYKHE